MAKSDGRQDLACFDPAGLDLGRLHASRGLYQAIGLVLNTRRQVLQLGQVFATVVGAEQQLAT
jgi:hypothetical protein